MPARGLALVDWALVDWSLMTMTRRHAAPRVSGIAACERTRRRALASAKNQRHDEQCRELVRRPHHLRRS